MSDEEQVQLTASPREVAKAKKLEDRARRQWLNDLKFLLAQPEFRRVAWRLMGIGNLAGPLIGEGDAFQRRVGVWNYVAKFRKELEMADFKNVIEMIKEANPGEPNA